MFASTTHTHLLSSHKIKGSCKHQYWIYWIHFDQFDDDEYWTTFVIWLFFLTKSEIMNKQSTKNATLILDYSFYSYFYSSLLCIVNFSLNDEISKWKPLTWKSQRICTPVYVTKVSQAWPFPFLQSTCVFVWFS